MNSKYMHIYSSLQPSYTEPVFVNLLSPGIDSQPGGPVLQPARLQRLVESIPWNRFLSSFNVYKFGLSTEAEFMNV
jgi:hypothetical protein